MGKFPRKLYTDIAVTFLYVLCAILSKIPCEHIQQKLGNRRTVKATILKQYPEMKYTKADQLEEGIKYFSRFSNHTALTHLVFVNTLVCMTCVEQTDFKFFA